MEYYKYILLIILIIFSIDTFTIFFPRSIRKKYNNLITYKVIKKGYINEMVSRENNQKKKLKEFIYLISGHLATRLFFIVLLYIGYLLWFGNIKTIEKIHLRRNLIIALTSFVIAVCAWFGAFFIPFFLMLGYLTFLPKTFI